MSYSPDSFVYREVVHEQDPTRLSETLARYPDAALLLNEREDIEQLPAEVLYEWEAVVVPSRVNHLTAEIKSLPWLDYAALSCDCELLESVKQNPLSSPQLLLSIWRDVPEMFTSSEEMQLVRDLSAVGVIDLELFEDLPAAWVLRIFSQAAPETAEEVPHV